MLALRSAIAADRPSPPIAVIDYVKIPAIARILSVNTIPSWILLSTDGRPASIITGFEQPDDVRAAIDAWLGTGR
jgi:thioredoxin-like negative regulator of GroEL